MDLTLIERGNLRKSVNRLFTCGMRLTMNLVQNYSDQFGNSQRSSLSPTGWCKEYISNYSSSAHTVKEQHAPDEHREIASVNTDNELTREIIEEDIDLNIPGLPHSTVKQLHGASVRKLIQKIENHPHRHALQRDLQQRSFNPFSQ